MTQLELFPTISLPPCGRNCGPCEALIEGDQYRCLTCGCVAPTTRRRVPDDPFMSIIEGFRRAQLRNAREDEALP